MEPNHFFKFVFGTTFSYDPFNWFPPSCYILASRDSQLYNFLKFAFGTLILYDPFTWFLSLHQILASRDTRPVVQLSQICFGSSIFYDHFTWFTLHQILAFFELASWLKSLLYQLSKHTIIFFPFGDNSLVVKSCVTLTPSHPSQIPTFHNRGSGHWAKPSSYTILIHSNQVLHNQYRIPYPSTIAESFLRWIKKNKNGNLRAINLEIIGDFWGLISWDIRGIRRLGLDNNQRNHILLVLVNSFSSTGKLFCWLNTLKTSTIAFHLVWYIHSLWWIGWF